MDIIKKIAEELEVKTSQVDAAVRDGRILHSSRVKK